MFRSLEQILRMVAKSKKVKDINAWVGEILNHCEISSDYLHFVNLKSNPRMWFGVLDTRFECQPFVVFRQLKNNDFEKDIREFEIYIFKNLKDKKFKNMVEDSYGAEYDVVEDFRIFYLLDEVEFSVVLTNGNTAKLGEYNDLSDGYKINTNLYTVTIDGVEDYSTYCNSEETLKIILADLNGYMEQNEKKSTTDVVVFDSPVVKVIRNGVNVPFEMTLDRKKGYSVKLI